MKTVEDFLLRKYPGDGRRQILRREIARACDAFIESGLADETFTKELCSGSEQKYWSCISEALLAARLREKGFNPMPSRGGGPDFLLTETGQNIWIEVICPEPVGVPSEWLIPELGEVRVVTFPHEQILLRWTSAIKEKAEKLIGNPDRNIRGYIEKGIVSPTDAYVIAVNGRHLSSTFSALRGISQYPFAAEAVFGIGPYQITINRDTLETIAVGHQHRPLISRQRGEPVPAYAFLDRRFRPISAIWAVEVDGTSIIGNSEPMTVVHNPYAANPIPIGFLPAHDEYVARPVGEDEFELDRIDGCLESRS